METRLHKELDEHPYPLLFAALGGAHLYGFPSPNADYDLRGIHILPLREVLGLKPLSETVARSYARDGLEMDLVTHDVRKFFNLLLARNGEMLEQLYSPLVLFTGEAHEELRQIVRDGLCRRYAAHYLGLAESCWGEIVGGWKDALPRLLRLYRVLLTGIYLMREGEVEANLVRLNESFRLAYLPDMIEAGLVGADPGIDTALHTREYARLMDLLARETAQSLLPQEADIRDALDDLLVRVRLSA